MDERYYRGGEKLERGGMDVNGEESQNANWLRENRKRDKEGREKSGMGLESGINWSLDWREKIYKKKIEKCLAVRMESVA